MKFVGELLGVHQDPESLHGQPAVGWVVAHTEMRDPHSLRIWAISSSKPASMRW
jgi:hypothetical protein